MNYDVLIIGAGPGGIFSAYELIKQDPNLRVGVFEAGHALGGRKCPIDGNILSVSHTWAHSRPSLLNGSSSK